MLIKLIVSLAIGGLCGCAANKIMKGASKGIFWNVVLGLVGGIVGGFLGPATAGSPASFFPSRVPA